MLLQHPRRPPENGGGARAPPPRRYGGSPRLPSRVAAGQPGGPGGGSAAVQWPAALPRACRSWLVLVPTAVVRRPWGRRAGRPWGRPAFDAPARRSRSLWAAPGALALRPPVGALRPSVPLSLPSGGAPRPRRRSALLSWAGPGLVGASLVSLGGPGVALFGRGGGLLPLRSPRFFPRPPRSTRCGPLWAAASLSALLGFRWAAPRRAAAALGVGFSPASPPPLPPPLGGSRGA